VSPIGNAGAVDETLPGLDGAPARNSREAARAAAGHPLGQPPPSLGQFAYPSGPGRRSSLSSTFASTLPTPGSVMIRRLSTRSKSLMSRATTLSR
jgi:hypothetical protein